MLCDAWFSELKNIFSAVQYCRFSGLSRLIERTFYAKPWFYTITIHYNNRSFGITIHYYNRYNKDFLYHYCVLWYFFISFALFEGKQIHSFFSPVRLKPATQPWMKAGTVYIFLVGRKIRKFERHVLNSNDYFARTSQLVNPKFTCFWSPGSHWKPGFAATTSKWTSFQLSRIDLW